MRVGWLMLHRYVAVNTATLCSIGNKGNFPWDFFAYALIARLHRLGLRFVTDASYDTNHPCLIVPAMPFVGPNCFSCMSLLRPPAIHTLPTELVREIVRACCDSYADITLPFPDPKPPAIPLSQFCSRWRAVAHNEPALWRNFRVDLPDELHGGQYEALMNFLANGAPANSTCLWLRQGAYRPPDLNPLLPIVVSFAHCLRFLSLELPGQSVEQLFSTSALLLHHLERLSVAVRVTDEKDISFLETPDDHVSQIFTAAPLLTGVTIGYDKLMPITLPSFPLSPWHFPRSQLTEFDASNIWIDVNQFFFILDCPNVSRACPSSSIPQF